VTQTIVFAAVAASAILLGAAIGAFWTPDERLQGALLAFAGGALITALAFELFEEAHHAAGLAKSVLALFVGAAVFTAANLFLQRKFGGREAAGLALVAAVTLDGVPENLALGVTLAESGSYALLVAIFASNFPEALDGAASIREDEGAGRAFAVWAAVAALLALSIFGGMFAVNVVPADAIGLLLAFAAGAILASIADTVLPQAFSEGGPLIAFSTTAGFATAYALAS
jgi:ZIP family zinc transporter